MCCQIDATTRIENRDATCHVQSADFVSFALKHHSHVKKIIKTENEMSGTRTFLKWTSISSEMHSAWLLLGEIDNMRYDAVVKIYEIWKNTPPNERSK
mmetsp:Transcript_19816/g.39484  ORF Transcript_19816/g.39484 Transcript_19816/m.39484 type:complete len:98 (+) Transcript_19816:91-384(+)